jgi:hypothetical protein
MVSRINLTDADGVVWLFPTSCAAKTLVGVIHLTQLSRPCPSGGHALAAVFARVVWSLASKLTGLASAVAILFPCGGRRVLEVAGVTGDALRLSCDGSDATSEQGPTSVVRQESIAAACLPTRSESPAPLSTSNLRSASALRIG